MNKKTLIKFFEGLGILLMILGIVMNIPLNTKILIPEDFVGMFLALGGMFIYTYSDYLAKIN
jgi:hypothetical protein